MNDAEPTALQSPTLIEDVTKMGNLSMAYETVDAEMSATWSCWNQPKAVS